MSYYPYVNANRVTKIQAPTERAFCEGGECVTVLEMHTDLLKRFYDNTLIRVQDEKLSDSERQEILHEACNVFSIACENIRGDSAKVD